MPVLGLLMTLAVAWPQRGDAVPVWAATPASATVGDTVWLERTVSLPAAWRLRAGRLDGNDDVESLGDPIVVRRGTDWLVRYPVTAWSPGAHQVQLPALWRLGPDAQADSVPTSVASFDLRSVIPASDTAPTPRPAVAPLRTDRRDPIPLLLAAAAAMVSLAAAWWWRRRRARPIPASVRPIQVPGSADERWLEAGEPRAVAARAAGRLRDILARLVPEAHRGLSTAACLDVVRQRRPVTPIDDLRSVLEALDRQAFDAAPDGEIRVLARRADALAERLER
jgi:hypothetical protein